MQAGIDADLRDKVILVDENDRPLGELDKLEAHKQGFLHRAFSVFIFTSEGRWLLQQRAKDKYHSPGLWTNACCSHPQPGEDTKEAAISRLQFEMGIKCEISQIFDFSYKAAFPNGLTEHEFDHVFMGVCDTPPNPNPEEVAAYRYLTFREIDQEIKQSGDNYTEWFKIIYQKVNHHISKKINS